LKLLSQGGFPGWAVLAFIPLKVGVLTTIIDVSISPSLLSSAALTWGIKSLGRYSPDHIKCPAPYGGRRPPGVIIKSIEELRALLKDDGPNFLDTS
jgi:hypothetical protein